MCDYSLMSLTTRLAREGEELIVHRFTCGAMGLVSPVDLQPDRQPLMARIKNGWAELWGAPAPPSSRSVAAVCVPPGARLRVWDIPVYLQREIGVRRTEEVTFTQLTASAFQYRDAIRFRNGHQILLQRLEEGQRVRVLSLSLAAFAPSPMDAPDHGELWRAPVPVSVAARIVAQGINRPLFLGGAWGAVMM